MQKTTLRANALPGGLYGDFSGKTSIIIQTAAYIMFYRRRRRT
jgi:hypothetical protein